MEIKGKKAIDKALKDPKTKITKASFTINNEEKNTKDEECVLDENAFDNLGSLVPLMIKDAIKANAREVTATINNMSKGLGADLIVKISFNNKSFKRAKKILNNN